MAGLKKVVHQMPPPFLITHPHTCSHFPSVKYSAHSHLFPQAHYYSDCTSLYPVAFLGFFFLSPGFEFLLSGPVSCLPTWSTCNISAINQLSYPAASLSFAFGSKPLAQHHPPLTALQEMLFVNWNNSGDRFALPFIASWVKNLKPKYFWLMSKHLQK